MFDIPHRVRFLKTHNGDAGLEQDCLLTSTINRQWQKIFNNLLIATYHYNKKNKGKNPDISFQKDVIDFSDYDAIEQRIALINYYLSDFFKEDFDDCYIARCYSSGSFDDFYFVAKINGFSSPLHLGKKKYRKVFHSKIIQTFPLKI